MAHTGLSQLADRRTWHNSPAAWPGPPLPAISMWDGAPREYLVPEKLGLRVMSGLEPARI